MKASGLNPGKLVKRIAPRVIKKKPIGESEPRRETPKFTYIQGRGLELKWGNHRPKKC